MKIRIGGGGIDKNGRSYQLPEIEREVADTFFQDLYRAAAKMPPPDIMVCGPEIKKMFNKVLNR